jgi:hypothetical protein
MIKQGESMNPGPTLPPAVMVVAHERSGTHFLMNTLAACYGYISQPWVDFDHFQVNINFYYPVHVCDSLLDSAAKSRTHLVKSHHQAGFFSGQLSRLTEQYVLFYVCRDPVNVMISHWRFVHRWPWFEGPRVADPLTFARSEPCGNLMRYQVRQHPNMMLRWASHVEGWLAAAATQPRVVVVRYEDLDTHFAETVHSFARVLGRPPLTLDRPPRDANIIPGGPGDPSGRGVAPDVAALRGLCRAAVGATMMRLGY